MGEKFLGSIRNCILLAACFTISLTVLGTSRLSSLMFVASLKRYGQGRKQTSVPFFTLGATRCITGPLVGYLGKRLGSEAVTLLGCVLAVVGISSCFLAETVLGVTISWGITYGIGIGLGTSLIPTILNRYFVRHIDKANGFFLGGECFGAIILPTITYYLLQEYGTSGTFLVLSGILLHSLPAALLLRGYKKKRISTTDKTSSNNDKENEALLDAPQQGVQTSLPNADHHESSDSWSVKRTSQYQKSDKRIYTSLPKLEPNHSQEGSSNSLQNIPEHSNLLKVQSVPDTTFITLVESECHSDSATLNDWTPEDSTQFFLKDIIPSAIKESNLIPTDESPGDARDIRPSEDSDVETKPASGKALPEDASPNGLFRVFVDPTFLLILLTQSSSQFALTTIFTIAVDYFRDAGAADHEHVRLLMGFAVSDTAGRFTLGGLTDSGLLGKLHFYVLCHFLVAGACVAFAWARGFAWVMAAVCGCGFVTGGLTMISPGIVTLYVEKKDVMMAMASRYTLFPVLSFTQPFLIGYFRESLGSYNGIFYFICGLNIVCGLLSLLIPVTARLRDSKKCMNSARNQDPVENVC